MSDPRPSATVLVVRDGDGGIEVLLGRRPAAHAFGGAWVFPGGTIDPEDRDVSLTGIDRDDGPWRAAALREVAEEVGIFLTDPEHHVDRPLEGAAVYESVRAAGARFLPDRLAYLSNWVTPVGIPKRFDTRFYLAVVHPETTIGPISPELEVVEWVVPATALSRHREGEIELIMPTIAHLQLLSDFPTAEAADRHARSQSAVEPVRPRLVERDGVTGVEIP